MTRPSLIQFARVALGGTNLKVNASRHKTMSYGRMKIAEPSLATEVDAWLKQAREADAVEDKAQGTIRREGDLRATTSMMIRYARAVIADWSGIVDTNGEPAPVTPENIDALMARWDAYERFDQLVFTPALNANADQAVDAA